MIPLENEALFMMRVYTFLLLIFSFNVFAESSNQNTNFSDKCSFNTSKYIEELSNLNNLKNIEINLQDYRKWAKNSLEAMVNKNNSILPKYKKRFAANIRANYIFGYCDHVAKIRLHGDWKDHIEFLDPNSLVSSVDVSLKNGSIANFVKFKLLLEKTRNGDNEIILANLLRGVGIISPKTSMTEVIFNGKKINMIIQEKSAKEMLESLGKKENFLFEGDERFLFNYENFKGFQLEQLSLSKIINPELLHLGKNNTNIALQNLSLLQSIYLNHANHGTNGYILDWDKLANNNKKLIEKWAHYEILMYASNSFHALRPHNRKFYLNSFYNGFEPIYFDGNSMSLTGKWIRIRPDFSNLPYLKKEHFISLKHLISNINFQEIAVHLKNNDINNRALLRKIKNDTLEKISSLQKDFLKYENLEGRNYFSNIGIENKIFKDNLKSKLPSAMFISISSIQNKNENFTFEICTIYSNECFIQSVTVSELSTLLEKKELSALFQNQAIVLLPDNINDSSQKFKFSMMGGKINIEHDENSQVVFNEKENKLIIFLQSINSWAMILDSNLSDLDIEIKSKSIEPMESVDLDERINSFGLTGCLNIYNSTFSQTSIQINSKNIKCEDSLNIINSDGHISQLSITDSFSDGLDIDFSNLKIDKVSISDAGNDCLDVSGGKYNVLDAELFNCKDKGLSIGESSKFISKEIRVSHSKIGISSKDSSISKINFLRADNVEICAEIFQKKQEFNGSYTSIDKVNCDSNLNIVDKNSILNNI